MSWQGILKSKPSMEKQIRDMESELKRELLKPQRIRYERNIKELQKEARQLIKSLKEHYKGKKEYNGEIEKFYREIMPMIRYFREGPIEIDDLSS